MSEMSSADRDRAPSLWRRMLLFFALAGCVLDIIYLLVHLPWAVEMIAKGVKPLVVVTPGEIAFAVPFLGAPLLAWWLGPDWRGRSGRWARSIAVLCLVTLGLQAAVCVPLAHLLLQDYTPPRDCVMTVNIPEPSHATQFCLLDRADEWTTTKVFWDDTLQVRLEIQSGVHELKARLRAATPGAWVRVKLEGDTLATLTPAGASDGFAIEIAEPVVVNGCTRRVAAPGIRRPERGGPGRIHPPEGLGGCATPGPLTQTQVAEAKKRLAVVAGSLLLEGENSYGAQGRVIVLMEPTAV